MVKIIGEKIDKFASENLVFIHEDYSHGYKITPMARLKDFNNVATGLMDKGISFYYEDHTIFIKKIF